MVGYSNGRVRFLLYGPPKPHFECVPRGAGTKANPNGQFVDIVFKREKKAINTL